MGAIMTNAASADLKVQVKNGPSGPLLLVNGKPTAPTIFFVNFDTDERNRAMQLEEIRTAAEHGVNLVSMTGAGLWLREGVEPDWKALDRSFDLALQANPNALLIPRIGCSWPPEWWVKEHPEEMMLYDDGKRQTASVHSRVWRRDTAAGLTAAIRYLEKKYGDHILGYHPSGQHTGEWFFDRAWEGRLSGFEEPARAAFRDYVKAKYRTDEALRLAWHDADITLAAVDVPTLEERTSCKAGTFRGPALEQKTIDFFEFQNVEMADTCDLLSKAVKDGAPDKLAVMFYGYHFELAGLPYGPQAGGHLALDRLLKSPYCDVVCSPVSYYLRDAGGIGAFMAPIDSVQAHGKLWLIEDDTRTHLASVESGYGRCATADDTWGVLGRNFGHMVTRGSAVWWMDLMGEGWFRGDEIWTYLAKLQTNYQGAIPTLQPYHPEIAVIVDQRSWLYTQPNRQLSVPLLNDFRNQWYRIGAPAGIYLLDDLAAGKVPAAKMYIILDAFRLERAQMDAIRKQACRKGCVCVWMYAPGIVRDGKLSPKFVQDNAGILLKEIAGGDGKIVLEAGKRPFDANHGHLSPTFAVTDDKAQAIARYEQGGEVAVAAKEVNGCLSVYSGVLQLPNSVLRDLAVRAGVHIYVDRNDVVAAGNGFVTVHAKLDGARTLKMPRKCGLVDALTGKSLGLGDSFSLDMKAGETAILRVTK